jgi:hypothetical protein
MILFLLFCILDRCIYYSCKYRDQTIYYLIHIFFNLYTIYHTMNAMYCSIFCPNVLPNLSSAYISESIIAFHLYHSFCYYNHLKKDDVYHHLMTIISSMCSIYWDAHGYGLVIIFWTIGLPGLFYYAPLFFLKNNLLEKKTELLIQYYVGLWIRSPGILYSSYYTLFSYIENKFNNIPITIIIINIMLLHWNAQYFLMQTMKAAISRNYV